MDYIDDEAIVIIFLIYKSHVKKPLNLSGNAEEQWYKLWSEIYCSPLNNKQIKNFFVKAILIDQHWTIWGKDTRTKLL